MQRGASGPNRKKTTCAFIPLTGTWKQRSGLWTLAGSSESYFSFTLQALLTDTNEIPQSLSSVQVSNALIKLKNSVVCFHIDIIKPL